MRILGIIPARYASSRFPGKPLADILGKPMIRRVYEQASGCSDLDELIVATDDQRIAECVNSFQGKVMMTDAGLRSGTERCHAVLKDLPEDPAYDIVINIQGDEPFIDPQQISLVVRAMADKQVSIATLVKKIRLQEELTDPNVVKVVFDKNNVALYFSRCPVPYIREKETMGRPAMGMHYKHIGLYAYRRGILEKITRLPDSSLEKAESLEQLRWLENGFPVTVAETDIESIAIDSPADLLKITNIP